MCNNYHANCKNKQRYFVVKIAFFAYKKKETNDKNGKRIQFLMMFPVPVGHSCNTHQERGTNHYVFKGLVFKNINAQQRETAEEKWEQGAMKCTDN